MNSHPIPPSSNIIKKKGEKHEGGLGQNPQKRKQKEQKWKKTRKKQPPTEI